MSVISKLKSIFKTKLQIILETDTTSDNIADHYRILSEHSPINSPEHKAITSELILGEYSIKGLNPNSKDYYFGNLSLTQSEQTINAFWKIGFSEDQQIGRGFVSRGFLCIYFKYYVDQHLYSGKAIYLLTENTATGFWGEVGTETTGYEVASLKQKHSREE